MSSSLLLSLVLACGGSGVTPGGGDDTGGGGDTGTVDTGPPPTDDDNDGYWTPDDCNDYDGEINPGATEVCDGVDNDCNGIVDVNDAVDTTTYYKDGDGDGYGDPDGMVAACSQPPGFVSDGTDCADDDPDTNPAAPEICNDGADNNCNGEAQECALEGELSLTDSHGIWAGEAGGDDAGFSLTGVGDVDGDGLDDMMVGAPYRDVDSNSDVGVAYLVLGPATGSHSLSEAHAKWQGTSRSDNAGIAVSGAGDVDGDGYGDLFIGAYHSDLGGADSGAAYLVYGPTSGSHLLGTADLMLAGEASYDVAGLGVSAGADLTGDGKLDLVVGSSGQGESSVQSRGRAYVVTGPQSGSLDLSLADATIDGIDSYDRVSRVAVLDDANGDGIGDLAVGAYTWPDNDGYGGIFVFTGPVSGALTLDDAAAALEGELEDGQAGWALSTAGDVNGDGKTDLLAGAPEADGSDTEAGLAYLVFGMQASGSLADSDVRFSGDESRANLGFSVGGGGDFDNDGTDDVVLGANNADTNSTDSGGAWLFYGPTAGALTPADADLALVAEAARDEAGTAVGFVGNLSGDCCDDIAVGAVENDRGGSGSGAVYLIMGQGL